MDDRGSVLVEHLLAMVLVAAIGLGLIQLALTVHTRNTLTACAAEAARVAARDDAVGDAEDRARACARGSVGVEVTVSVEPAMIGELSGVTVSLEGPAPVLAWWHAGAIGGSARAINEAALGAR